MGVALEQVPPATVVVAAIEVCEAETEEPCVVPTTDVPKPPLETPLTVLAEDDKVNEGELREPPLVLDCCSEFKIVLAGGRVKEVRGGVVVVTAVV